MTDVPDDVVLVERRGQVGIMTLNRPRVHNAVSREVTEKMAVAIETFEADDDIRVLVVTGAGERTFCAGADLKALMTLRPSVRELGGFAGITARAFRKPIIAAVNGTAVGGGMEICLACDLVVAEEHASFGLPEVRRGIIAAAGGVERLTRRLPPAVAMEIILTAERVGARRALELGLVNRVVPRGTAVEAALELAALIALGAPMAIEYSKAVARTVMAQGEAEALAEWAVLRQAVMDSDDADEGVQAFAEKRAPRWTGK
ncbi:MAG: crotonase/enoyl-CoA hydratase family protein [Pseudonocardia sp.]|uniref:crotonase/enoyl-CoA hydratase family protein n=1 Tax=unclassified Pseudonocardia TaxID=2619320 RepID=UPI00086DCC12|nr:MULTISPECIES: crotonase/enoyl-CoA hydratase family protein [unclassified Pseudonocardia]MBN9112435.1 crotonase/enoyl-CoA hydratase family protein [Pseudonocardia sp.]ODU27293.1 MAG: hypothetical protein ABS80_03910 [Pseudonocardia sp. SCN 72-51]ODV08906.1 MAG: hypothetical protein ABT15_01300 [Pseudonocardia sp. SCN 73-27]